MNCFIVGVRGKTKNACEKLIVAPASLNAYFYLKPKLKVHPSIHLLIYSWTYLLIHVLSSPLQDTKGCIATAIQLA